MIFLRRITSALVAVALIFLITWLTFLPINYFRLGGVFSYFVFLVIWWALFALAYKLSKPVFDYLDRNEKRRDPEVPPLN